MRDDPGLCFSRAMVGLGEGVAPSAATDMVARVIVKVCLSARSWASQLRNSIHVPHAHQQS